MSFFSQHVVFMFEVAMISSDFEHMFLSVFGGVEGVEESLF